MPRNNKTKKVRFAPLKISYLRQKKTRYRSIDPPGLRVGLHKDRDKKPHKPGFGKTEYGRKSPIDEGTKFQSQLKCRKSELFVGKTKPRIVSDTPTLSGIVELSGQNLSQGSVAAASTEPYKNEWSQESYNSNDGMLTSVWGPSMWHYLHTMSFNYPVKPTKLNKLHYYKFIYSLKNVLPCGKCRKNLKTNFQKLPLTMKHMDSRMTFSKYIYDLHELINTMLGKKSNLTYEMVRDRYEHFRARCIRDATKGPKQPLVAVSPSPLSPSSPSSEKGCIEPLYGKKTKCILRIVPIDEKCDTFQMSQ